MVQGRILFWNMRAFLSNATVLLFLFQVSFFKEQILKFTLTESGKCRAFFYKKKKKIKKKSWSDVGHVHVNERCPPKNLRPRPFLRSW